METISKYILDDEDVAFEYELQRDPTNSLSWNRYIEIWKEQHSKDSQRRPVEHIVWLYNRLIDQFKDDINIWNEYIMWMIQINTVYQGKYTELVLQLHERCLGLIKSKDSEKMCIQFLKIAVDAYNLSYIRKSLDISLQRIKNKSKHADLWDIILLFLREKLIPVCSTLGEEDDLINFGQSDNNNNIEDGKSDLERLEILVYKSLFGSKDDNEHKRTDEYLVNIWASQILERYLNVCPVDKINDILLLLSKTYDYHRIQLCFKKFLFSKRYSKDHGIPYSLYLIYLNSLNHLKLLTEYNELLIEVQKIDPKEEANLIIFDVNNLIRRRYDDKELGDRLMNELSKTKTLKEFMTLYSYSLDFEQAYINIILQETKTMENSQSWKESLTYHISRLDKLLESRDIMISDLRLRQNSNSIEFWRERINIKKDDKERAEEYGHALSVIDPLKVNQPGELAKLWCEYAQLYWNQKYYPTAREVYGTATKVPFPHLEDLEMIYFQWINNELKVFGKDYALNMLSSCLEVPESFESDITKFNEKSKPKSIVAQTVLFNSLKLWTLYLDLLESKPSTEGNIKTTIEAYETIIRLKLVTPLIFANYANFISTTTLNPMRSYKIYERMLNSFSQSVIVQYEIWMKYLSDVIRDRSISNIGKESIRELFENCIAGLKGQDEIDTVSVYLQFNNFEETENNGNPTRQGIRVLLDGARSLADKYMISKVQLWQLSIEKTMNLLGPEACRPIYEECIEKITPDSKCVEYIIQFATLESGMQEWKRVRELLQYGAQLIAPNNNSKLWTFWEQFELQHGDKDQYKRMLTLKKHLEETMIVDTEEVTQQEGHIQFVSSTSNPSNKNNTSIESATNPNEIDLDI